MSGNRRFVDTNILVYAHDDSAAGKRDQARALVEQLWQSRDGCLSVQVLQEFFVTVTRKIAKPLSPETAKEIITDLSRWYLHAPAADDVLAAISIHQDTGISFWDAMIVRSAAEIGCTVLYSEDLNPGQKYTGVLVENPFQSPGADRG
jgi:predicted nucleic acid-binding protein